ncbi:MAG: IPT/TIG domain-containing protein [Kofleriaceae bacterium]
MVLALGLSGALGSCADDGAPRLSSVAPPVAARGMMVTIDGDRLCGPSGDCDSAGGDVQIGLEFPYVKASVVSYSATRAVVVIPSVAPVGPTELVITVDGRSSNALALEVLP